MSTMLMMTPESFTRTQGKPYEACSDCGGPQILKQWWDVSDRDGQQIQVEIGCESCRT